jgi:hypothetical protein
MRFTAIIVALSLFVAVFAAPVPVAEAEALALPEAIAESVVEPIVARDAEAEAEPCHMNLSTGTCQ